MPQVIEIKGIGPVEFPDDMSDDQIIDAIETDIVPQFQKQPVIQATPVPVPEEAVSDNLLGRFAGALSENAAIATQGAGRVLQQTPMYRALQLGAEAVGLGEYGPSSNIDKLTGFAREVQAQSRPSYGVTTPADTLVEQVVEGAASLPTVIAAGPAAPAVNAVLMGETRRQEAQQYAPSTLPPFAQKAAFDGRALTPEEQEQVRQYQAQAEIKNRQTEEAAFGLAGALGFGSEWALGIPAMLKGGGGRRLLDTIGLGIAREGTQEGVDEFGGNVIAKGLYDPNRDVTEGVKESITVGGILGAPLGPLMQGPREGAPVAPEAPDLTAVASVLEDTDQPDLTGFGSAARESIPPPLPPSPTEQVSATVLGKDVTELRQQEAIATGQPVPIEELERTQQEQRAWLEENYPEAPESPAPEAVEAPLAPEEGQDTTQTPEGLVAVDPDTYERLADEPVREGWVGYQDPATLQVFQVPEGSTPEIIQARLQEVQEEELNAYRQARDEQMQRELMQERFDQNVQTELAAKGLLSTEPSTAESSEAPILQKDLLSSEGPEVLWNDVDRLKFQLDRQEMNLKRAQAGTLKDSDGTPVRPQDLENGVKALRERYNELKGKIVVAKDAFKGMKKGSKEQGSVNLAPVFDLGASIYRKGMAFADWSRQMVKHLGSQIRPFLADLWSSVVSGVNSLSPAGRRFKRSGSVGRQSPQEVYDVFSEDLRASKADTKPNQDFGEADKQAVRDAYAELQAETGFAGVSIADVMERAGFPLSSQSKGLLMQMYRDGEITSLNMGDWSLSDARKRAWGVRNNGDIFLTVTMPQGMRRSAPAPEGGAFGGQGGRRFQRAKSEGKTFTGLEGKERYEIDDSQMEIVSSPDLNTPTPLGEVIQHNELFDSYPAAKDIEVVLKVGAPNASYNNGTITITGYNGASLDNSRFYRRALLHEIQHWIQDKEGFARGGSVREWNRRELREQIEILQDDLRAIEDGDYESSQDAEMEREGIRTRINNLTKASEAKNPQDYYERLAGEYEARDVSNRMTMTAEERASTAPYSSEPMPDRGLIQRFGNRYMQSTEGQPPPLPATDEQRTFSVMNAKTDEARVKMGLPPAMAPARITFGAVWDEAMAIIAQNPDAGQELTTSLALRPRVITPVESAILTHESIRLDTAYERALDVVNQSATEGELEANRNKMNRIGEEAQILFDVTRSVGTLAGQNLAARKLLVNQDLTLARMVKQTRAAQNGRPLSEKQQKDIEELHKKLKATEDELKRLQDKESKQEAANTFSAMMKELKADRKEAVKSGKTVTDFLNEQAEKARERLRSKMARTSAGVDPTILVDVAIIGASHIANGINTAAEFANRIVQEFGEEFRPYIPEIFKQSQEFHDANSKAFNVETKTPTQPTPQEILKEATTELDPRVVFELARAYVRSGMTKMEEVMDRIHQDLLPLIPGLEVRDVRDAFSGYGKVTYPSRAEDLVKLREMKVLARLTSQLEDVLRRQAPLRTGPQRDKLTADARILQKQINDLMRKYNIRSVDPLQQLKTSREAVKARLRNEIEELEKAITTRTQRPQGRTPVEPDEETKVLQARRDKLRERYEELFPRAGLTPEQRIQQTLTALDKAISEETQMLRDGILKRTPKAPGVTSPEIENKQMELDALRQLRRELFAATQPRKAPEDIALEQAVKAAEASIKRMDEMLKSGNLSPAAKARRFTPTAELEALWSERDAMRDALHELRKAEKPRKDPEEIRRKATIKALEKSIAMLDGRILSGDFSTTPQKANRPEVKEVAELREIRDQMRKTFNDLKKARTPTRSPEEIALERDKKNIRKRITQLQEKLAKGDYSTAPKKEPAMDREKRQLQYDYQKLREEYLKGVNEARMKAQNPVMKGIRVAGEVINTSRAILTSMDFSGVLRQGGFIVFGNPVRAMKSFPAMFKAFGSEKGAFEVKEDIRKRENYPLYQASKLYLADDAPASLNQMEEAFMSRWANRIPFVAGSQRAYVTFLNKLRADSFDAMIEGFATGGKPTLEESRVIANFINVATGRGSLGSFSGAGAAMNTVFFAPRYVVSRFQLLAGQPFYGGNARTRIAIAKEYTKYLIGIGSVLALLAAAGDDDERGKIFGLSVPIELDPVSSDFLKVRFGNTRLDPFSGLLQITTVVERMRRRETKTAEGKLVPLSGDTVRYGGSTTTDVMFRFIRSKFAPAVGSFIDWREEKNVVGEKVTPKDVLLRGLVPISFGEILDTMKEQGIPRGTALSLLSMFGIGLQTYEPREKKTVRKAYEASKY